MHADEHCIERVKNNIPPEYLYFHNTRKTKDNRSKRNSGGIIIFYRKHLLTAITVQDKKTENMLWVKINKNYLNLDKDQCIGTIYNSPINSTYTTKQDLDFSHILLEKMTTFSRDDHIIIGGDVNSRTGTIHDYVNESEMTQTIFTYPKNTILINSQKLGTTKIFTQTHMEKNSWTL